MHVQLLPYAGAPTVPFVIDAYLDAEGKFFDYSVPRKGEVVEAFYADRILKEKMNLLIDEVYPFEVEENGRLYRVELKVEMAPDGTFYLTDGKGKLYFGQKFGVFYCYNLEGDSKVLKNLFVLLSKLPLNLNRPVRWRDYLPLEVVTAGWKRALIRFFASFYHDLARAEARYENPSTSEVKVFYEFQSSDAKGYYKIAESGKFIEEALLRKKGTEWRLRRVERG
jgi:hypothetical protein